MSSIIAQIKQINDRNEKELQLGYINSLSSWHEEYKNSAYIHISGIPYALNEGDILQVFSEYGEPIDLNLVRDEVTGKSKGFCFLCYEDQRSSVLAVDNLNGAELLGRKIKVAHTNNYFRMKKQKRDDRGRTIRDYDEPNKEEEKFETPQLFLDLVGDKYDKDGNLKKKMKKKKRKKKTKKVKKEKKKKRKRKREKSSGELEEKRERMKRNKERDYENRKLQFNQDGEEGSQEKYKLAYGYGRKMQLNEGQFDMKDLKVYKHQKYVEESEKYKLEREEEEMKKKNARLDRMERLQEKKMRDLQRRSMVENRDIRRIRNNMDDSDSGSRRKRKRNINDDNNSNLQKRRKLK